eukprot:GFYU01001895.1.p2 GENE.GFYU01001895.1~~GFYU01001895.1.p2  ORF type:complete len:396 (+),score=142.80 GFYU01001895.1:41-1189(+)
MAHHTDSLLDPAVTRHYYTLPQGGKVQAEYVWIGGSGADIRCKTRTLTKQPASIADCPEWNFDGSSTGQAPGEDSEVILKPAAIFPDPFRQMPNVIVLCDCYTPDGKPLPTNNRFTAKKAFDMDKESKPWFGIEQEYTLYEKDCRTPFGWPKNGFPGPQGPYYCSIGVQNAFGRDIVEAHYRCCLYAGLNISGINAEVMAGQWEYQIGPCEGIESGDHLWMSRYLMQRLGEQYGVVVSFDPKPMAGDWNGAGCHTNYSTAPMRAEGGMKYILEAIKKMESKHEEHIAVYGAGNEKRLTGAHETASIDKFSYGVANRGASIRIPRTADAEGKGYFEDRRPASNMDPYVVTAKIFDTTVLDGKGLDSRKFSRSATGSKVISDGL